MARKKPPPESTCRHCGGDILYSSFVGYWVHLRTLDASCGFVATPVEKPEQPQYSAEWGVT